jgi:hypothetical protein
MSLEDNEMLDRAMDAAEASLTPDEPEAPETSEAPESPEIEGVDASTETEGAEPAPEPVKAKTRDASGKFAAKQPVSDQSTNVEPESTQAETFEPASMPAFWPAELKKAVAQGSKEEVIKNLLAYDTKRSEGWNRFVQETEGARQIAKQLHDGWEANKDRMVLQGIKSPIEELERYRAWDKVLTSDIKSGIRKLMADNGLTPESLYDDDSEQYYQEQSANDPRVEEALARAQKVEQEWTEYRQSQERELFVRQVDSFKDATDSQGQLRRPFAEKFAAQITQRSEMIGQANPELSLIDVLTQAYDEVKSEVMSFSGSVAKPNPAALAANAQKAQAAASSVNGAPSAAILAPKSRLKGNNFNEKLDSAINKAFDAVGR